MADDRINHSTPTRTSWHPRATVAWQGDRSWVMGIINATPDSFSDGGDIATPAGAAERAVRMVIDGAACIDIGGESTRPGATRVDSAEQRRRVLPVIAAVRKVLPAAVISVDTTLAEVASAALDAGADAINDVSGGQDDPAMLALVAARGCGYIAMHRLMRPAEDVYSHQYRAEPSYAEAGGDVVAAVRAALRRLLDCAGEAGVMASQILLDPGLGFGKSVEQNAALISRAGELLTLGRPLLCGASRKSFVAKLGGIDMAAPARERLGGSIGACLAHRQAGASVFRVHDVGPCCQALRVWDALAASGLRTPPKSL